MNYYSLKGKSDKVGFDEATIKGQAPDGGLYFPDHVPVLPKNLVENIASLSKEEIAVKVISPFIGSAIPENVLEQIVAETINFNFPLSRVTENSFALELFHGPTLAFKDVGARFMSRCLGYFVRNRDRKITVLVATSGDTGGAVANGFYGVDGVDVVILYPSGKVSGIQGLQLTTPGKNISALEINGTFDDCQNLVKQAFADVNLNKQLFLTSANSINVARWLPQQFYYFFAFQQWADKKNPPVFSVPSGNFGNLAAGLLAYKSGLPAKQFIAACNANDVFYQYLQTGNYNAKAAVHTISNAMDVGNPSNFPRVMELFNGDAYTLKQVVTSFHISDAETADAMKQVYHNHHYLTDPHGAVAFAALERYLAAYPAQQGIFLETAHPVKFYDVVEPVIGEKIALPDSVSGLLNKPSKSLKMDVKYEALENYLLMKQ